MSESKYWDNFWNKRVGRRKLLRVAGASGAGLIAAQIVGCGDDDDTSSSPTGTGASTATATATPRPGGKLSFGFTFGETPHLDIHEHSTTMIHVWGPGIPYSRLVKFRTGPDVPLGSYEAEGDLAASWEQPDESTFIFEIHPGANFHDIAPVNGRAVTAEDVIYSFQRQRDLKVTAAFLPAMASEEAVGPKTLKLVSASPNVDFLATLGGFANKVIAREVVEEFGDLKEAPVIGSGAWILEEWVPNSVVRLRRNPDYFREGLPYADELDILRIADQTTYQSAFETGEIVTLFPGAGGQGLINAVSGMDGVQVIREKVVATGCTTIKPKGDAAPANDMRVRQAIRSSINRQDVIDGIYDGEGWLSAGIFVPGDDWLLPESEFEELLKHDVTGANALLQEAGFVDWQAVLKSFEGPVWLDMAQVIQPMLQEIGVSTTIEACNTACIGESIFQRTFDILLSPEGAGATATSDLQLRYKSGAPRNPTGIQDPELDALIEQQAAEFDEDRRRDLINQIQRRVIEISGSIPVGNALTLTAVQPFLQNYYAPPYGEYAFYENLWLSE